MLAGKVVDGGGQEGLVVENDSSAVSVTGLREQAVLRADRGLTAAMWGETCTRRDSRVVLADE